MFQLSNWLLIVLVTANLFLALSTKQKYIKSTIIVEYTEVFFFVSQLIVISACCWLTRRLTPEGSKEQWHLQWTRTVAQLLLVLSGSASVDTARSLKVKEISDSKIKLLCHSRGKTAPSCQPGNPSTAAPERPCLTLEKFILNVLLEYFSFWDNCLNVSVDAVLSQRAIVDFSLCSKMLHFILAFILLNQPCSGLVEKF